MAKHFLKQNGIFEIHAQVGGEDTANGKPISSGVMFMSMYCGEGTTDCGKKFDIGVCGDGSIVLTFHLKSGLRHVRTNLKAVVNAAILAGGLTEKIDFTEADATE